MGGSFSSQFTQNPTGNFLQSFGSKAGGGGGGIGQAAVGTGLTALGTALTGNPLAGLLLSAIGTEVLGGIFGSQSPFEQAIQQQVMAGNQLLPQLQAQAAGQPSAASRGIQQQLRQQTTSAQQSFAASATARGGGGTPVAAQQARFREAETGALATLLGQQQLGAQQQLLGVTRAGLGAQGLLEQQENQARGQLMSDISRFLGGRAEGARLAPELESLREDLLGSIRDAFGLRQSVTAAPRAGVPAGNFASQFTTGV